MRSIFFFLLLALLPFTSFYSIQSSAFIPSSGENSLGPQKKSKSAWQIAMGIKGLKQLIPLELKEFENAFEEIKEEGKNVITDLMAKNTEDNYGAAWLEAHLNDKALHTDLGELFLGLMTCLVYVPHEAVSTKKNKVKEVLDQEKTLEKFNIYLNRKKIYLQNLAKKAALLYEFSEKSYNNHPLFTGQTPQEARNFCLEKLEKLLPMPAQNSEGSLPQKIILPYELWIHILSFIPADDPLFSTPFSKAERLTYACKIIAHFLTPESKKQWVLHKMGGSHFDSFHSYVLLNKKQFIHFRSGSGWTQKGDKQIDELEEQDEFIISPVAALEEEYDSNNEDSSSEDEDGDQEI